MVYVTRREHFNAAHRLYNPAWSEEDNLEVFGPCANPHFHGHNFELWVTVVGDPDPMTGFVMDMRVLGQLVRDLIVEPLDHKNLNLDVPFLAGKIPSCEVVIQEIWKILEGPIAQKSTGKLHHLKLLETRNNTVEYYGPGR